MPTYQYACTACDHRFEAVQSFSDDALSTCPNCGGKLRKVFSSVGIVFKGSGFYRTDSRSGSVSSGSSSESAKSDSSSSSSSSDSSSSGSSSSSDSGRSSSSTSSTASSSKAAAS
ncbi:FmdB family transcriptional regulator [Pseudonocardia sp. EV170527-09]|uniref:FmdB family zinc ribbon protein n=1 Tax=Pseudonocardia sp. EV170527-09 TaxID=2603411 RepID=UPI0011F2F9D2|nr:FmdB family zinc ribbon protein [Pseudonocardia sp. EV170527-09]KAA1029829.1 FmdB family transcriptional regulator [Pseudonocardia sp. EV170527-09]